ncbi:MAG: MBL fold metallo-hydrolase [Anaerolineales bacterium]|nr:MBL fold metallo-hydrolase [Anaerolineales bacterium]MCB8937840.1 MBL fold metallo-hydrolase [Ardenticatenaceae bacterium]
MKIQLIRNATLRVRFNGRLFLVDPFLAAKETIRSFAGISQNPIVELPMSPEAVIDGAEMVLVSHLHPDHFDEAAINLLPKTIPILCQPGDEATIREKGFVDVTAVSTQHTWQGITFTRTPGRHGYDELAVRMGHVSGFIWEAPGEPKVYWMGDTVWYEPVAEIVAQTQPHVIVTHSSGAKFGDSLPIVMDAGQTTAVCQAAPNAVVIAVHLESLDHGTVTRASLRVAATAQGISNHQLRIPADGEIVEIRS